MGMEKLSIQEEIKREIVSKIRYELLLDILQKFNSAGETRIKKKFR